MAAFFPGAATASDARAVEIALDRSRVMWLDAAASIDDLATVVLSRA